LSVRRAKEQHEYPGARPHEGKQTHIRSPFVAERF
jgi:hypothetical protein